MAKSDIPNLNIDFEKMIGRGENPQGFTAQTANGTAHWRGTGWNKSDYDWERPQLASDRTRREGRSNRTGE